ncbi:MAG: 5-(carboxyamino)imidazole ribonucleotide synthase [Actinomycetales bacterium]|nr:5-(carboxyamino)imidazole ribonucleotide synthase [Actinomycetales bacterium]
MMQAPALALGIQLRVLATSEQECALQVIPDSVVVPAIDAAALQQVAGAADVLTFEHEHVDAQWLAQVSASGVPVRPGAAALHLARDKAALRQRLSELGVPQPRWQVVADASQATSFGDAAGWPMVLKPSRGGYDGRGVFVVEDAAAAAAVMAGPLPSGAVWLAEEFVPFRREVAAQVARSPHGQAVAYPLVRTVQRDGMCAEVVAPCPDSDEDLAGEATHLALSLARDIDAVGMLAVEMYVVIDDSGREQVLVNEIALRPHNSGHWSIDGAVTSQFENHLRAVLDLPLGDPTPLARYAVMVNVIGADADNLHHALLHCQAREPQARIHIYGKAIRPGRKVGHVTLLGDTVEPLLERARHIAAYMRGDIHE